jgi:hypothetical protein
MLEMLALRILQVEGPAAAASSSNVVALVGNEFL